MPRNPSSHRAARLGAVAALLVVTALTGPASGQGVAPIKKPTAPASAATPVADLRAPLWGATARFVYADDPALAKMRSELEQTIDDGSLRAFGRSLDDAVRTEQRQAPSQSHVLKFQGIFKEIQAQNLPPSDLPALVNAIKLKLEGNTERMANPARRQQLTALITELNRIATATGAVPITATTEAGLTPTEPTADALAQAAAADTAAATPEVVSIQPPATPPVAPVTSTSMLPMISLLLSALSLLGVLYLLLTRNRTATPLYRPESEPEAPPRRSASAPIFSLSQHQELQKMIRKELAATNTPAARQATGQKPQPTQGQRPTPTPAAKTAPAAPAPAPPSLSELAFAEPTPTTPVAPPAPRTRTIYVNQQPLDGAFRRDNLADAPASYTIFEISVEEQSPDYGTFVVTRNEAAHGGYIGSHHSILEPACMYSYPQGAVSRIITDTPGIVQRQPSGDWHISQKAKVHFV